MAEPCVIPLSQVHTMCQKRGGVLGTEDPLLVMEDDNEKNQPFIPVQKGQKSSDCVRRPKMGAVREDISKCLLDF